MKILSLIGHGLQKCGFMSWDSLDFAGGTPVHIASGAAYSLIAGKRAGYGVDNLNRIIYHRDAVHILLWFGWFGFNWG